MRTQESTTMKLAEKFMVEKYDHEHTPQCGGCAPVEVVTIVMLDGEPVTDPDQLAAIEAAMEEA